MKFHWIIEDFFNLQVTDTLETRLWRKNRLPTNHAQCNFSTVLYIIDWCEMIDSPLLLLLVESHVKSVSGKGGGVITRLEDHTISWTPAPRRLIELEHSAARWLTWSAGKSGFQLLAVPTMPGSAYFPSHSLGLAPICSFITHFQGCAHFDS